MYKVLDKDTFYPDLVAEIEQSQAQIIIDAYIWINDEVGKMIARALLGAAERGVRVWIRKDLSASIFEHTPGRVPFFMQKDDLTASSGGFWNRSDGFMTTKTFNALAFYIYGKKERPPVGTNALFENIKKHKNIFIENRPFFNHGKLILIDHTAYVGGQCISKDYTEWIDYNVKITELSMVENIYNQVQEKGEIYRGLTTQFCHNIFSQKQSIHHILRDFVDDIGSGETLIIEMSYFGKWFIPTLKKALKRGVKVSILASKDSDTNHHTNMWVLSKLMKEDSPLLKVFLSERMIHTKGLATAKKITLGATNFHNACGYFKALNEQNVVSTDKNLVGEIFSRFVRDLESADLVREASTLPEWSRRAGVLEIVFVWMSSYFVFLNRKKIQKWRDLANEDVVFCKRLKS